ncbi:MAG: hypothetical protein JNM12_05665 [Alphaproteobacteria bacterium]|nr:hypothetical protein [Alphaproteobacteria bacterium]
MNSRWAVFGTINCVIGIINIALFALWWSLIGAAKLPTPKGAEFYVDSINTQLAILDTVIVSVSLLLAVAGLVGYNAIKCGAELKAEETAKAVANQKMSEFLSAQQNNIRNQAQFSTQPNLGTLNTGQVSAQPLQGSGGTQV